MATSKSLVKLALNPFDLTTRIEREEAGRFFLLSLLLGFAIGLPGAVLGVWLRTKEASLYEPGQTYVTFEKFFFLPMVWGLCGVFMGVYRPAVARWPWLDSAAGGAKAVRMIFALLVLSAVGVVALLFVFGTSQ